jgi:predicted AAA+ superfamily ATPase
VGKTWAVRELGAAFSSFVEVNFDLLPEAARIFEADLRPGRICRDLSLLTNKPIRPGETLLFLDEVQQAPRALTALRYFHELMPQLHVIAAGSLLDFAIDQVGLPVGRVSSLFMYPLSIAEFIAAVESPALAQVALQAGPLDPPHAAIHERLMTAVTQYLAVGGMPEAVAVWREHQDLHRCSRILGGIAESYRQDFQRYAARHQQPYVERMFGAVPGQLGRKFKYSAVSEELRKRELAPALDLLVKAGVVHKALHSSAQGLPLSAQADDSHFKVVFLDCALAQTVLGLDMGPWILQAPQTLANRGAIVEAFVGQELLCYGPVDRRAALHYWHRESPSSNAEVDYVVQRGERIVPIEVKSGAEGRLRSMHAFLSSHPQCARGIRFSSNAFSSHGSIDTRPLYAVAGAVCDDLSAALAALAE